MIKYDRTQQALKPLPPDPYECYQDPIEVAKMKIAEEDLAASIALTPEQLKKYENQRKGYGDPFKEDKDEAMLPASTTAEPITSTIPNPSIPKDATINNPTTIMGDRSTIHTETSWSFVSLKPKLPIITSYEDLINELFFVTMIDDDHLPARVQLGILYYESGDLGLSEHWLDRAIKRGKARGAGGGRGGVTTVYCGMSGVWGWEAWRWIGLIYGKTGRPELGKECLFKAIKMERIAPVVRGFECLARVGWP